MHTARLFSTLVIGLILMASCDPPVNKPANATAADTATVPDTTTADTATVADTGIVATENPQPVQSEDRPVQSENQPVQSEGPVAKAASVTAAKAVQTKVIEIKVQVDRAEATYKIFNFRALNTSQNGVPRNLLKKAKAYLERTKLALEDPGEAGLRMLSQKAVEAAKAVVALESSTAANEAVAKAAAVKTAADKTDDPSAYFQTAAAEAHVVTNQDLTATTHAEDLTAIKAAKASIDELKALADAAAAAAAAVQ